jgi:peptide/nickel transport system substrate-binding protein
MTGRPTSSGPAKPTTRRRFMYSAAAVAGGLAVTRNVFARTAEAQTTKKTELVIAQSGDISKLDPHLSTAGLDVTVTFNLYDNLVSRRRDNKLHPSLAVSWSAVQPTTWQFKLRPGVKFHNGDPFSSADVKFSIERTYDPQAKTNVSTIFTTIDRIDTPDALTVNFVTKKPDPLLPARLAFYGGQIMPKKYFEAVGADQFNAKPIGSGPVRFVSWRKDDQLVLDAVPDYWGGRVGFNRLIFRPIPETAARIAALLKGEVDMMLKVPPDHIEHVRNHPTTKVESALFAGQFVLAVNSKRPPWTIPWSSKLSR